MSRTTLRRGRGRDAALRHAGPGLAARLAVVALLATGLVGTGGGSARAVDTALPDSLRADPGRLTTIALPVPVGVVPEAIRGQLETGELPSGQVVVLVDGQARKTVPVPGAVSVEVPLGAPDVRADRTIEIGLRYDATGADCLPVDGGVVALRDLVLVHRGAEAVPTTIADFFPAVSSGVEVVVPAQADDGEIAGGLAAVAALSRRYPAPTPVRLVTTASAATPGELGRRVVQLATGPGPTTVTVGTPAGVPTLVITGPDDGLVAAARALDSTELGLLTGPSSTELAAEQGAAAPTSSTLAELGQDQIALAGPGRASSYTLLRQDAFGGPVSSYDISLRGTHSAVATGTEARLDAYVDGRLAGSETLGGDPDLELDLTVPSSMLASDSGLELVLRTIAPDGCARGGGLPIQVDIDGGRSTVTAHRGRGGATGLQLFPQVLGREVPVAIVPSGASRTASAADAALLIGALQRAASGPLDVTLLSPTELLDSDRSGLLVGASESDVFDLDLGLRLSALRVVDTATSSFSADVQQPFAALQATEQDERDLLVLGAWAPGDQLLASDELMTSVASWVADGSWNDLSEQFVVAAADGTVGEVAVRDVVPQEGAADDQAGFVIWLVIGCLVVLAAFGGGLLRSGHRSRRLRELVRLQAETEAGSPPRP